MSPENESEIFLDRDVLAEEYLPQALLAREESLEGVRECLYPVTKGQRPLNVWLSGKPGTGKTSVAKLALAELRKRTAAKGVYVNCWTNNSFFAVLDYILGEIRAGFGDTRDTTVKLKQLGNALRGRPFWIILDEVDLIPSKDRSALMYGLLSLEGVGLACISEGRLPILALEARVKSRLNLQTIGFQPYSAKELQSILQDRAERGLRPRNWKPTLLRKIAAMANGDARTAIQTLKNAAVYAEREGAKGISAKHVKKGFLDTDGLRKEYEVKRLSDHHRLIFELIRQKPGILSPDLYIAYAQGSGERNWRPVARRTFSLYTQRMAEMKLITCERARVKGRVYEFKAIG